VYSGIIAVLQPVLLLLLSAASPQPRPDVPALPIFGAVRALSSTLESRFVKWYMGGRAAAAAPPRGTRPRTASTQR
jgi:hypothetical protein